MPSEHPAVRVERAPLGKGRLVTLLGPAFVAAIAYVDPGNVAANLTAGAQYGYLLVWVLVAANAMAVLVQYLSAKLGLVSGKSLPELLGLRLRRWPRRLFWVQAEAVAIATDLAEVIGGAIALNLLFGVPLFLGGLITGVISMAILAVQSTRGQRTFEFVVIAMLAVITVGFLAGLFFADVDAGDALGGLVPGFDGADSVLLAASMLGATVMPHAIYLHSALARDRHGDALARDRHGDALARDRHGAGHDSSTLDRLLRATKWDVGAALVIAGTVNIGMLVLAAAAFLGAPGTDTIEGAHAAIESNLGGGVAAVFAVGLLASGFASTSIGCAAGAEIMKGLLQKRIPILVRRVVTLIPALVVLGVGADPTMSLVLSQVVLSLCIPFALIPLVRLTSDRTVMAGRVNSRLVVGLAAIAVGLIVALNVALLYLTLRGQQ